MTTLLIYLAIGALAGLVSGFLGIGGGSVLVPSLLWAFHTQHLVPDALLMQVAAGTSLASMLASTLSSAWAHRHQSTETIPLYRQLAYWLVLGVVLGAVGAHFLHSRILVSVFALFLIFISFRLLFRWQPRAKAAHLSARRMRGLGLAIGAKSGLLGLGGGALIIPILAHYGHSIRVAVAVSALCSFTVALAGMLMFSIMGWHTVDLGCWATGYVYWPAALSIWLTGILGARIGAFISHRVPVKQLRRIFAVFLMIVGIKMVV